MSDNKKKTLAEAAIDVLQASAKSGQDPMKHVNGEPGPAAAVVDLGGATSSNPAGDAVGAKASAVRSRATPPKGPAVEGDREPKSLNDKSGAVDAENDNADNTNVKPPSATPSGNAPLKAGAEEGNHNVGGGSSVRQEETEELTAEEIEAARQARVAAIIETMKSLSVEEDVNAIFTGSELSEETKTKIKTVFEAAVIARAVLVVEKMESEIVAASDAALAEVKEELETQVDSYLDHMVEQWMKSNEVAIESSLRTEIVEDFIGGLRTLFLENSMDVPEEAVPVVEGLAARVEELEGKLNETLNTNVELTAKLNESAKVRAIAVACEGLTATQANKLKTLAEGVEFATEGEYAGKLAIVREQYFPKNGGTKTVASPVQLAEAASAEQSVEVTELSGAMAGYVSAISRTVLK